jgi:asparagine synthase (glutamine-hydrolysing)
MSEQTAGQDAGVSLSGGVDSACIVAAFRELYPGRPLHTFTAGSSSDDADIRAARDVAELYGTNHHEIVFGAEEIEHTLPTVVWHLEDPIARSETLQYYLLAKTAREFVSVLLTGQIADGLYAGMPRHKIFQSLRFAPFLRKPMSEFYAYTQTGQDARTPLGSLLQKTYFGDSIPAVPAVIGASGDTRLADLPKGREALNESLLENVTTHIPQWFAKVDRPNFAHGLAVFSPFIDRQIIDQAFRIPASLKIRRFREKHILRHALAPLLPKEFSRRPKYAQRMTYDDRFSDLLQDYAARILTPERVRSRGLFVPGEIARLLDRAGSKAYSAEHGMRIWTALCTELWASLFIDHRGARPDAPL